jgi:phage terminase large subunit GpA-like protein
MRVLLFLVGVDTAKELIFARLQIDEQGPGYMHFNGKCDEEYFKQLTAEKLVTRFSKGFPHKVWVKARARNEALDCEVYALAALTIYNPTMAKQKEHLMERVANAKAGLPEPPSEPRRVIRKVTMVQRFRDPFR